MPRRTLNDLLSSRIPAALKLPSSDPRVVQYINEALEMIIEAGAWWGLFSRYRASVMNGLLVWPREVAGILAASVQSYPVPVRSMFWEFLALGMGIQGNPAATQSPTASPGGWGTYDFIDRGTLAVQTPIGGTNSKLQVYCDQSGDVGTPVTIMGFDGNGNWIRTLQGGVWLDGEVVQASTGGTLSVNIFSSVTGLIKPVTDSYIRLYAQDVTTLVQSLIGVYEYDETNPLYRASYCPALDNQATGSTVPIEVIARMDFVPLRNPTDFSLIGNIPAIKAVCCAIADAERTADGQAKSAIIAAGMNLARGFLENELRHYGGAPEDVASVPGVAGPTGEVIESFI